jgi:regulator of sigma E protease
LFLVFGKPSTTAQVESVEQGSAAAAAGFQPGDVVTAIDGSTIESFTDMQRIVSTSPGQRLSFKVKRGDATVTLLATPDLRDRTDTFGNVHHPGVLGITRATSPTEVATRPVGPLDALWLGVKETWFVVDQTGRFIGGLFRGNGGADQLGGPIRIVQISGQAATLGIASLIHLAAVLSISIGLLNLFPVPLLDGGHLMYFAVEAVRGHPLSDRAQELGFRFGLALVLMLMIFTFYNDILHLSGS